MAKVKTIEIVDLENVRKEKLRYQKNTLAYGLGMLGCFLSLMAGFIGLNSVNPDNVVTLKVFLNIVILLFGFSNAERVRRYNTSAAIVFFVFAGISVLRIFWYPLNMIRWYSKDKLSKFSEVVSVNGDLGKGWLSSNGTFRGILMMIFLILSGLCFAFAGYVGLSRSNKLHAYLKSINVEY